MKNTPKKPESKPIELPTRHSYACDWRALRGFVFDTLADAMHHPAVLAGAQPKMTLMLSRRFLPTHLLPAQEVQRHLETLSRELRRQGVFHVDIHTVVAGNAEPPSHELSVTLHWL